jgi:peptide chain release factor 1
MTVKGLPGYRDNINVEIISNSSDRAACLNCCNNTGGMKMFDRLEDLLIRMEEILSELQEPDVANDQKRFRKLMKEQNDLSPIVEAYKEYKACKQTVEDSLQMLEEESDEEMRELAKEELNDSKARIEELERELKILLLPKDPNDEKNVIVEIRAGAGGDEAALFAAEIYRMYLHYAEGRRWKVELVECEEIGIGGMKNVTFMINGSGAYSVMKYESGVHRVQRVPETESGGRIHTSTITVAVIPEAEEVDVQIDEKDIRIDVMRASGNGGQCVNTTDSAVRLTHYPTGIVIYSQTEKSQLQNKDKAFALLRAKLYDLECQKQHDAEAEARKSQIGTGDRSEKIRTYNFPQGRVTDHRIGLTLYKLDKIMNGDIQEIIDACIAADQSAKLANMNE